MRAAILLSRLKFSPGEIASNYNDNLAKAIAAFQSVSGLSAESALRCMVRLFHARGDWAVVLPPATWDCE